MKQVVVLAIAALVLWGIGYVKRRGLDRVIFKAAEKPERLIGSEVEVFDPTSKGRPGWISPLGKVISHDGEYYDVQMSTAWQSPWGDLSTLKVKTAMDGNPLSKLAGQRSGSTPIQAVLPDGRIAAAELGIGASGEVA